MNKITRKKNTNYTCMSNVFLRDNKLSLKAKGLLATIMSLPDNWDFSIKGIVKLLPEGRTAVYSAIDELKKAGYCTMVICRENNKITGNDYTFYEEPIAGETEQNLHSENMNVEKMNIENETQINNKYNKEVKKEKNKDFSFLEKEKNSQNLSSRATENPTSYETADYVSDEMKPCWSEWTNYLKRKRIYDEIVVRKQYPMLIQYSHNNPQAAQKIIDFAIMGQYRMFIPLSDDMLTQIVGETSSVATKHNVVWE